MWTSPPSHHICDIVYVSVRTNEADGDVGHHTRAEQFVHFPRVKKLPTDIRAHRMTIATQVLLTNDAGDCDLADKAAKEKEGEGIWC